MKIPKSKNDCLSVVNFNDSPDVHSEELKSQMPSVTPHKLQIMKHKTIQHWMTPVVLSTLVLAGSHTKALGDYVWCTFDADASCAAMGDGAPHTLTWAPTGNPGGSGYFTVNWANNTSSWQDSKMVFAVGWPGVDCPNYVNLEFDVKVDIANSHQAANGNYGYIQLVAQGWNGWGLNTEAYNWNQFGWVEIKNATGWQHFVVPLSSFPHTIANCILNFASNGPGFCTNTISYWVDNVMFTSPPLPPPTFSGLKPGTTPGLTMIPAASGQWQRVMVYPNPTGMGTNFGWYGSSSPVSYSFTVTNFPSVNDFAANLFLVPNVDMPYGRGDTSVDWNCTNGLFLNFTANTSNPATNWYVSFSAKTNVVSTSNRNPNYTILGFNYRELPVGTWTLRFNNNTDITITAPNGFTTNYSVPADIVELASGNAKGNTALTPYFGIMPRTTAHIGEPTVFSRIQIQGVQNPIDDNFSAGYLNTSNTWSKLADQPSGIFVTAGQVLNYLVWNTPNDTGFQAVQVAASPAGPWREIGSGPQQWFLVGTDREATILKSAVNAALGGSETNALYFRLLKRGYAKLQVLLPGETADSTSPTGKTGTPAPQQVGVPFTVVVNAVSDDWHLITSVTDTVHLISSDPQSFWPTDMDMSSGTVTFADPNGFTIYTPGTWTITATDVKDPTKTGTSSPVVLH